jgi:hypothetical protein
MEEEEELGNLGRLIFRLYFVIIGDNLPCAVRCYKYIMIYWSEMHCDPLQKKNAFRLVIL